MRLIDSDALVNPLKLQADSFRRIGEWVRADALDDCIVEIGEQPTVDAAPVVHARWIQYEPDLHGTKPLECGACHYLFARLYPRDFCPHCGAKMDGGGDDE